MKITHDIKLMDNIEVGDFLTIGAVVHRIVAFKDVTSHPSFYVTTLNESTGMISPEKFDSVSHLMLTYKKKYITNHSYVIKHTKNEDVELIIRNGVDIS